MDSDLLLGLVVATALAFDFTNGFHDTANVVATSISTRALPPRIAVGLASMLNFVGAFLSLQVAATIASGIVDAGGVTLTVDSQTQVLRRGQPVAAGISAIREGTQVRASFDPASNRADKIEVMGRARRHSKGSSTSSGASMNTDSSSANSSGNAAANPSQNQSSGTTEQGKANSGDQTTTPTPSSNPK